MRQRKRNLFLADVTRGGAYAPNGASLAAVRVENGTSPGGDRLPAISPDFEENRGQSLSL